MQKLSRSDGRKQKKLAKVKLNWSRELLKHGTDGTVTKMTELERIVLSALESCKKATQKQIPQELSPLLSDYGLRWKCPVCGKLVDDDAHYCKYCGQAICDD